MMSLLRFGTAGSTRARGAVGEEAARQWLRSQGFQIVTSNYRVKPGEIDVIATEYDGEATYLCFIEIKARATDRFGSALAAVPVSKQQRISRAASAYLMGSAWDGPCRFDVLGLEKRNGSWNFELVRDAFWGHSGG